MRTIQEYEKVKELADKGLNKCQIGRETGIPRGTICEWLLRGFCPKVVNQKEQGLGKYAIINPEEYLMGDRARAYAYILGEYLGDGYIRTFPRTYRLSIYNDKKYEGLNKLIENELQILFPNNKTNRVNCNGAWEIYIHSKNILNFFPQHGTGKKWQRKIELTHWQYKIIDQYPKEFLKGLFYSDGAIYPHTIGIYSKTAYCFVQKSKEITKLLLRSLRQIGIEKELYFHPTRKLYLVQNFKKDACLILSGFLTPKSEL